MHVKAVRSYLAETHRKGAIMLSKVSICCIITALTTYTADAQMAPKNLKALRLLMDHPQGLYGSELVKLSDGYLSRGTVYTLLDRLVAKGFVREIEEPATLSLQFARTRHLITAQGRREVHEYAEEMGFVIPNLLPDGGRA